MTAKKARKQSVKSSKSRKRPDRIIYPPAEEAWVWVESKIKLVNGKYVETVKAHPPDANICQ
jgi:hypothetical protein